MPADASTQPARSGLGRKYTCAFSFSPVHCLRPRVAIFRWPTPAGQVFGSVKSQGPIGRVSVWGGGTRILVLARPVSPLAPDPGVQPGGVRQAMHRALAGGRRPHVATGPRCLPPAPARHAAGVAAWTRGTDPRRPGSAAWIVDFNSTPTTMRRSTSWGEPISLWPTGRGRLHGEGRCC